MVDLRSYLLVVRMHTLCDLCSLEDRNRMIMQCLVYEPMSSTIYDGCTIYDICSVSGCTVGVHWGPIMMEKSLKIWYHSGILLVTLCTGCTCLLSRAEKE